MRSALSTIAILVALAGGAATAGAAPAKLVAKMHGEATKQNGAVRLTQAGGSLQVEIALKPAPATAEPAEIHRGDCSKIGPVAAKLNDVVGGRSSTTISELTLAQIRARRFAVLVHSGANTARYVSCGDIGRGARLGDAADESGFGGKPGQ